MARNHAVDCHMCVTRFSPPGLSGPRVRSRKVSTQMETGLTLDQAWSQLGKVLAGTNAVLAKTNGKIRVKLAACTASTLFRDRPAKANIQVNAPPTGGVPKRGGS